MDELLKNVIGGIIRHGSGAAATWISANGLANGNTEETIAGALALVGVVIWSAVNKYLLGRKVEKAKTGEA